MNILKLFYGHLFILTYVPLVHHFHYCLLFYFMKTNKKVTIFCDMNCSYDFNSVVIIIHTGKSLSRCGKFHRYCFFYV